ncbi:MAG TPA: threonine/serine dehydratase [Gemmatimonadales bacterium]|nr:threonine/serine dehydratase [Gemmatimonadales bacterium]
MPHTAPGLIEREHIAAARAAIAPYIRRTPVLEMRGADLGVEGELTLKLELLQHAGSFKARGAFANLLLRPIPPAGIVAASGGNHGAAVAYAAKTMGVPARIYIPRIASPAKIERIRSYGAELIIGGEDYTAALEASEEWAAASEALRVHAFDQEETLCGQGTLAAELQEQAPRLDTLLLPVGGGGLLGGVASWYGKSARLIGVEPEGSPTLTRALEAGRPVDAEVRGIAADSLAPRRVGDLVFPIVQRYVNRVILVSDEDIREAQATLWSRCRIVAEPGGAAATAALLKRRYQPEQGERVGVVISGGNTVAVDFSRQEKSVADPGPRALRP